MRTNFQMMPDQASTLSGEVDALYYFLVGVTAFFTLLIFVLIVYFALKYRRRRPDEFPAATKSFLPLEIAWSVIPLGIVMVMFGWGAKLYVRMYTPPTDAMEVYVIGRQWMWKFQHPEGPREINELHIPAGRPIKLITSSQDVIHSVYIPAFRMKHDVLPGRYTSVWFEATQVGEYHLFCAEYCGTEHSRMRGRVIVMEPAEYQAWLSGTNAGEPPAKSGGKLFQTLGCITCHGERAPTMAGLFASQVKLADGKTVAADDDYLRESILDSTAKIVAGYAPIMPSYRGQITEEQLNQLVAYIKSLRNAERQKISSP